ncbi:MAG: hypothetical protein LBS32_03840 [Clostridiales Family XIII bacterium]|nr:hypothetical protein [Clostridiales Family XIII bacterium]
MFRRLSLYAGIALMLIAVAGLVFWESAGRDRVMMAETVAAAGDIRAGAVIKPEMLRVLLVP